MSSPTEQLIRHYISRLSVAAQSRRMSRDDRRALMDRTRAYIEHSSGLPGPATTVKVAAVISSLGDPSWVVANEIQRLAEARGEPAQSRAADSTGRQQRARRGESGRVSSSRRRPALPGSLAGFHGKLSGGKPGADDAGPDAARAEPAGADPGGLTALAPAQPADRSWPAASQNGTTAGADLAAPSGPGRPGDLAAASGQRPPSWPHEPARRHDAPGAAQGPGSHDDRMATPGDQPDQPADADTHVLSASGLAAGSTASPRDGGEFGAVPVHVASLSARAHRGWDAVIDWSRDKTLESVAVILLGLGGLIFPPIWLIGAIVALFSKVWDYKDKWLGLALPVLVTIVGTAAGLIVAGSPSSLGEDVHVGWIAVNVASRVAAVLGTAYLAWRSAHGRRPPAVPPWNKPHRVG